MKEKQFSLLLISKTEFLYKYIQFRTFFEVPYIALSKNYYFVKLAISRTLIFLIWRRLIYLVNRFFLSVTKKGVIVWYPSELNF